MLKNIRAQLRLAAVLSLSRARMFFSTACVPGGAVHTMIRQGLHGRFSRRLSREAPIVGIYLTEFGVRPLD